MSLLKRRDLNNPLFVAACLRFGPDLHGVKWAKKVFAFAGFPDKLFYAAIEEEEMTLKKVLTLSEKERIVDTVKKLAFVTEVDKGGYKCSHPLYGEWALRNRENKVGLALAFLLKSGKMLTLEGETEVITDPIDSKLFIVKNGGQSGFLKKSDITGYWSNYKANPLEVAPSVENVFKMS
ncbi:MAG: hypothetical protein ACRDCE_15520 [Cetobacterium sp.]|uniref:hypothetical protein n=1 Tax=Cetobacterium sp. TaxID=2071632 RepID=UPI003EE6DCCE